MLYRSLAIIAATTCACVSPPSAARLDASPDPEALTVSAHVVQAVEPPPRLSELVARGRQARYETARGPLHVWTPADYDAAHAILVVYVHGYFTTVDRTWDEYRLPEQFAASGLNAMFVACEAPSGPRDRVAWPSLGALVGELRHADGIELPAKQIVAVGHSAAYRTVDGWLVDPRLATVVRLDAAYGGVDLYRAWMRASRSHRLVDVAQETRPWARAVHSMLPGALLVDADVDESWDRVTRTRSAYIAYDAGHFEMVRDGAVVPQLLRALGAP